MENVVLTVHLILALLLIGVVLLQRSEGGGLGMGGGGSNGAMSSRGAASALAKVTWGLAALFIATSLTLTWMAAVRANSGSVVDGLTAPVDGDATTPPAPGGNLLPELPSATSPAADAPATTAPVAPAPAAPASN